MSRSRMASVAHATLTGDALRRRRRTERLLAFEEEQRGRIAQRLEQGAVHALVAALLELGPLEREAADEQARERVEMLRGTLAELVVELREVAGALRPALLEGLGLAAALEGLAASLGDEQLRPVVVVVDERFGEPPAALALSLYRVVEDLLAATAGPAQVRLRSRTADRAQLVAAIGEGRVPGRIVEPGRLALARARVELLGGLMTVADRRGGGVLLHAELPLPVEPALHGPGV